MNNKSSYKSNDDINTEMKILLVLIFGESLKMYTKFGTGINNINTGLINMLSIKSNLYKISQEFSFSMNKSLNTFIDKYDKYLD